MLRLSLLMIISTLLLGCSQFPVSSREPISNNDKAYLKATMLPRLVLPEDIQKQTRFSPLYPIPAGALPEPGSKAISARPPGLGEVVVVVETVEEVKEPVE